MKTIRYALLLFFFAYPCALFLTPWLYPLWERFGLRWQVLCVSSLLAAAIAFIPSKSSVNFCSWFVGSPFRFLLPLGFIWLIAMGLMYGIKGQQFGSLMLASYLLLLMPVGAYVVRAVGSSWFFLSIRALSILVACIVLSESIFLTLYVHSGLSWSDTFLLSGINAPRVFMNIRDGNCLSVLLFCLACIRFFRFNSITRLGLKGFVDLEFFVLCFVVLLNALLTDARALLVACLVGLLLSRSSPRLDYFLWLRACLWFAVSFALAFVVNHFIDLFALADGSTASGPNLFRDSSSRLLLWDAWIRSGISHSFWFGGGFNHNVSAFLPSGRSWPADPHNIFILLFSDSGIVGVTVSFIFVLALGRYVGLKKLTFDPALIVLLSSFGVFASLSDVIGWSNGMWCVSVGFLILCQSSFSCDQVDCPDLAKQSYCFFAFAYLAALSGIQVGLVSVKQVLAIPQLLLLHGSSIQ